jgi:hypothetical protein
VPPESTTVGFASANVVFEGVVTRVRAGTMPVVPVSDRTIVVRVGTVLRVPTALVAHVVPEQEITLFQLDRPLVVGKRAVFFADTWLVGGDGLAVRELSRDTLRSVAQVAALLPRAEAFAADSALRARLRSAELVIQGRVLSVGDTTGLPRARQQGEHDPQWRVAAIAVDAVLRGSAPREIGFLYPTSNDVLWFDVPKPGVGERAIWVLRRETAIERLVLVSAADRLDISQLARVRALLARGR